MIFLLCFLYYVKFRNWRKKKSKIWLIWEEKFPLQETLNLVTAADRSNNNIFLYRLSAMEVPWKCRGIAMEVPLKCCWSAVEVPLKCKQPTATATYIPLLTPPLSTVGWSKPKCFNNFGKERKMHALKKNYLRTILGILFLTRCFHDTWKWAFP